MTLCKGGDPANSGRNWDGLRKIIKVDSGHYGSVMHPKRRHLLVAMGSAALLSGCLADDEADPDDNDDADDDPTDTVDDNAQDDDDMPEPDDGDDGDELDDDDEMDDESEATETVSVGHGEEFVFDPDTLEIEPGETVEFVWDGGGHNIIVTEQPEDGEWDGVDEVQDEGYTHSHEFAVEGRYEYICGPHEGEGMAGEILVGDADPGQDEDDDSDGGGRGY